MKFIFAKQGSKGGVYKILNTKNGRVYIGSTSRFRKRWNGHRCALIAGTHTNTFLQNDFNRCGADNFIIEILEVVEGEQCVRLEVEQEYLDKVYDNQRQCYNLDAITKFGRLGQRNKNPYDPTTDGRARPKTEEEKKIRRKKSSEFWNKPEMRKFASERAQKKWANHKADITVRHVETGETVYIDKSLRKFCEERSLQYKAFHLLSKGYTKKSQGWVVIN